MSDELVNFLRGVDEGVGDGSLDKLRDEIDEHEPGEKLRFDVFNDNYTQIEILPEIEKPSELEETDSWVFPVLYKKGAHGDMLRYQIGYNAASKKLLWTVGRVETGGLVLYNTDIIPTRAQKGSFQKKAYSEALNRVSLKQKNGFHEGIKGSSKLEIPLPMLANKYQPPDEEGKEGNAPHLPLAAQAKFDGERNIVFRDEKTGEVKQMSRLMNLRPYFDHVREECGKLLDFLPPGTILDGELYSDKLTFQLMTSIAGVKTNPHPRERELDFFVFDLYHPDTVWRPGISKTVVQAHQGEGDKQEDVVYMRASGYTVENYTVEAKEYYELPHEVEDSKSRRSCLTYDEILKDHPMWVVEVRVSLLMNAFHCYKMKYGSYPRFVKLVKTYIVHRREDIQKLFGEMTKLDTGGPEKLEGIMLRHLSRSNMNPLLSLYRPGRSNNLLKVKGLNTTEVIITGVRAGRGKAKDLAILVYKEPDTGIVGTVVPAATHEERRDMLLHPEKVKGRILSVSFQNRMKSGAMRFPVGLAFVEKH